MIRSTTNGVLKSYRYRLQSSTNRLNDSRDTVLSGRNFNSFAEDPTTAARAFQIRSSLQRAEAQHRVGESVVSKYDVAWSTLDSVINDVNNAKGDSALTAILNGANGTTGSGRTALGQELTQLAGSIVRAMNAKYGDNFVFAGADGLNVPLVLEDDGTLRYRGIDVTNGTASEMEALDYLVDNEKKFADLGLGLQEDENGEIIESSAFNVSLHAISYLGYGKDKDGDPKNIACIINRMGEILLNCDEEGRFHGNEETEFRRLVDKFNLSAANLTDLHTQMDARAAFLKSNQTQLEHNIYTLQEQIVEIEDVDTAEAITSYSWAQYCYNAALKVGNSILSQSLMDYLNS